MSRYINADDYENSIKPYDTNDIIDKSLYNFAHNHLMSTPTADVRPNVCGEIVFIKGDGITCADGWECSVCKKMYHTKVPYFDEFEYCPNCGSKWQGRCG